MGGTKAKGLLGGERISEAEHAVMEALWVRAPMSAAEVGEAVGG